MLSRFFRSLLVDDQVRNDLQVRSSLLQLRDALDVNLRLPDVNLLEILHRDDRVQPCVGHGCSVNVEIFEVLKLRQMLQSGVGHLGLFEVQFDESAGAGELGDSLVVDFRPSQIQRVNALQTFKRSNVVVADFAIGQVIRHFDPVVVLSNL